MDRIFKRVLVPSDFKGSRLDKAAAALFPDFSRSRLKTWIESGALTLGDMKTEPKVRLGGGEELVLDAQLDSVIPVEGENIPLTVVHEDKSILIIDKPSGLVVHPGAGNRTGTLVNALLHHDEELSFLPRAGIVHRLDKDTSGIMVVAKNEFSYLNLVSQLKERKVNRHYLAIVVGEPLSRSTINEPIGRHPKLRTKQAVTDGGKEAITNFKIQERMGGYSLLNVSLETGRTHQIRVHLAFINFPILGDSVYGGRKKFAAGTSEIVKKEILKFPRQALHAEKLEFIHPTSGKKVNYSAKIPKDFIQLIEFLKSLNE